MVKKFESINVDKFKSIFVTINFCMDLTKENLSKNALLSNILKKGNATYPSEKSLKLQLAKMYNSNLDIVTEKLGNIANLKFVFECINNENLKEKDILEFLVDYIKNPNMVNGVFSKEQVLREIETTLMDINEEKDNKRKYALVKLENIMFENSGYGTSVLGDENIIKKISAEDISKYYFEVLKNAFVCVSVVGNIKGYEALASSLNDAIDNGIKFNFNEENLNHGARENIPLRQIIEKQDVSQSVIAFGLDVKNMQKEDMYTALVYTQVLGANPASLMFQNVREKASLAYFAKAMYNRQKNVIYAYAGVMPSKYEMAKNIIMEQFELMRAGNFSDEQFEASKDTLISTYNTIYDSKEDIAKVAFTNEIYFGENVEVSSMIRNIENVTREDVIKFAQNVNLEVIYCLAGKEEASHD